MDIILYLLLLIQYQHKQICWLLNFICRYIPLKQWAFDDSIHPNIKNFGLTSFQRSSITRNGITKNISLIWNGGMAKRSNLFSAGTNVILTTAVPAHAVMPRNHTFIKTMVPKGSSSVKYSSTAFSPEEKRFARPYPLKCPYCSHSLVSIKKQKHQDTSN